MSEIQDCLPPHSREHFIRVRNVKRDEAKTAYNEKLIAARQIAASRGYLRSGAQLLAEWNLSEERIGNMARGYFEAAIETCNLYDIPINEQLCDCIRNSVRCLLIAQRKNAIQNAAGGVPGSVRIPNSVIQQISGNHNLPRLNEILIELEKARVLSMSRGSQKDAPMNQTLNVTGPNARVNINSTDNSSNVVHNGLPFANIRRVIESGIHDDNERRDILTKLGDLEAAQDRESGSERYQKFISTVANHMVILGPYLPALGHWVHSLR